MILHFGSDHRANRVFGSHKRDYRMLPRISRKIRLPSPQQLQPRSQSTFKFECKGPRAHEASGGGLLAKSRFALRNVVPSFVLDFWFGRRCQAVRQLTNSPVESSAISSPHRLQLNRHGSLLDFVKATGKVIPRRFHAGKSRSPAVAFEFVNRV